MIVRAVLRIVRSAAALVAIYYVLPLDHSSAGGDVTILAIGLAVFIALVTLQVRSPFPACGHRSLATNVPLFLLLFAGGYVAMSALSDSNFDGRLMHTDGLYFTVTVFSTVGFGDITAKTQGARLLVTGQRSRCFTSVMQYPARTTLLPQASRSAGLSRVRSARFAPLTGSKLRTTRMAWSTSSRRVRTGSSPEVPLAARTWQRICRVRAVLVLAREWHETAVRLLRMVNDLRPERDSNARPTATAREHDAAAQAAAGAADQRR